MGVGGVPDIPRHTEAWKLISPWRRWSDAEVQHRWSRGSMVYPDLLILVMLAEKRRVPKWNDP